MTRPGRTALPWLLALVAAAACGLVAFGVWAMWRSLRAAEAVAQQEARRALAATARSIEAAAVRPELLAAAPAERRFALREGHLEVPADLEWWHEPPAATPSFSVEALLARADRLEFGSDGDDASAAAALLDEALAQPETAEDDRAALLLSRAFLAGRRDDTAKLMAIAAELVVDSKAPASANAAGCLLLGARAGQPPPSWAAASLRRMPPETALPLLDRLRELRPQDAAAHDGLAAAVQQAAAQRRTLRVVAPLCADLAQRQRAQVVAAGNGAVVYQPAGRSNGSGAWLDAADLARALATVTGAPVEETRRLVLGGEPPAEAIAVWPGIWLPADPAAATPGRSGWLVALLLGLALLLLGSLWLALRALVRERQALAVRSEFLSSVTHELKTPLTSIRLFSEMLRDDRAPSEAKRHEYARLLVGEAGRLQALVANVLDLGRLERGERSLDRRDVELTEIVEEALAVFAPVAGGQGMRLETTPLAPACVHADRAALLQALLNLLDNAAKYAASGGRVEVGLATHAGRASVTVRDHGPGIAAASRERIFERFVRGADQSHHAQPGLGLGLYMARSIARAHGGDLRCAPPEDGGPGVCFVLTLPCVEVAA